jgi:hypothetical protein
MSSDGDKNFSDEELLHWIRATTLDPDQPPVVILHIATEAKYADGVRALVEEILDRFRGAFALAGAAAPRFLLVGSYMHLLQGQSVQSSRTYVEALDTAYAELATAEPDCAFFSLSDATDGTFFTSDIYGGAGAQQAAREWLDDHGWSTITFGGATYHLSSDENGGLDGVLVADGTHLAGMPAAAFYAKLLGDAIAAAPCPGDFNGDGANSTQDIVAFLNAWVAQRPDADFNGDGTVNTADVIAFLNAWNEPC